MAQPARTDAEAWREFIAEADTLHAEFEGGHISVHLYRARLFSMGFRGHEIESEVMLHWPTTIGAGR